MLIECIIVYETLYTLYVNALRDSILYYTLYQLHMKLIQLDTLHSPETGVYSYQVASSSYQLHIDLAYQVHINHKSDSQST